MEAVWKIEVRDFPAFIIVNDKGNDFFAGPAGGQVNRPAAHHRPPLRSARAPSAESPSDFAIRMIRTVREASKAGLTAKLGELLYELPGTGQPIGVTSRLCNQ